MPTNSIPPYLASRYKSWRSEIFEESAAWYARLATEGQHPRTMVIACCDSRIDLVRMFGAEPGDLFVVRNVANLVPPYAPDDSHHSTSAAIEYAVTALKAAHIVVLGHYNCGGAAACLKMCAGEAPELEQDTSFIGRWIDVLRPTAEEYLKKEMSDSDRQIDFEKAATLASIQNLKTFPFVASAIKEGVLTLSAAWIDLRDGRLHVFEPSAKEFQAVE